jgi:hypothetical protein
MPIDPARVALFIPKGLKKFKLALFERIGALISIQAGRVIRDEQQLGQLPDHIIPIVGCTPTLRPLYQDWIARKRTFLYWDRGYYRRVFATWLPRGAEGGYYRWTLNKYQLNEIRDVPDDRWRALNLGSEVRPWRKGGKKIVIADTLPDYWLVRGLPVDWSQQMAAYLKAHTDRPIVVRHKESKLSLFSELQDAHCLVTHGSIAAVEAVVMGCPVFVDQESAASPVGRIGFDDIENPVYPDRFKWMCSLSYNQWNERELCDGTLFRMLT